MPDKETSHISAKGQEGAAQKPLALSCMCAIPTAVGEMVARQRKALHLSLREVADKADVSPTTVLSIENGDLRVRLDVFLRVLDAIGLAVGEVIPRKEKKPQLDRKSFEGRLKQMAKEDMAGLLSLIVELLYADNVDGRPHRRKQGRR